EDKEGNMSTEQNKDIVRRAIAALGRGDFAGFVADAADDFTFALMGGNWLEPIQGKQRVREALEGLLTSLLANNGAIVMTIDRLIAEGDYVVEQARGQSRTKDGRDYNNTYCRVWRIVDGKVKSVNEYMDIELARSIVQGGGQ
ncbi:MAG: nuclear transport factor 2 family protein, partial [Bacillota bacterium]